MNEPGLHGAAVDPDDLLPIVDEGGHVDLVDGAPTAVLELLRLLVEKVGPLDHPGNDGVEGLRVVEESAEDQKPRGEDGDLRLPGEVGENEPAEEEEEVDDRDHLGGAPSRDQGDDGQTAQGGTGQIDEVELSDLLRVEGEDQDQGGSREKVGEDQEEKVENQEEDVGDRVEEVEKVDGEGESELVDDGKDQGVSEKGRLQVADGVWPLSESRQRHHDPAQAVAEKGQRDHQKGERADVNDRKNPCIEKFKQNRAKGYREQGIDNLQTLHRTSGGNLPKYEKGIINEKGVPFNALRP